MIRWRWLVVPMLVLGVVPFGVARAQQAAETDSSTMAVARRLLRAMHAQDNVLRMLESGFTRQRMMATQGAQQLPPVFFDSALMRMKRSAPELVDSMASIYARRFTRTQLETMAQFYESPTGQLVAGQQAALAQETMAVGQRFGVRIGAQVAKDLSDAGVLNQ